MLVSGGLTVAYIGNFDGAPWSTENHVAASLESLGHRVARIQEGQTPATEIATIVKAASSDVLLWTQTLGLAITSGTIDERNQMLHDVKLLGVPTVGYHLDLWWGLDRQESVLTEPFFTVDYLFTADGGHDELWKQAGVNHHWLPPAVYHAEAHDGTFTRAYASDIAFVGSHFHYGHEEHWPVRRAMLDAVTTKYRSRFKCWPRKQAIRGKNLNDLYASVKVCVGDSCLAGKIDRYWSDRISECTGRGGFLIHPNIVGLKEQHPHLVTYPPGDWNAMLELIDYYLTHDEEREMVRKQNAEHTREHHTYRHRIQTVLDTVL